MRRSREPDIGNTGSPESSENKGKYPHGEEGSIALSPVPYVGLTSIGPTHPDETIPTSMNNSWLMESEVMRRRQEDDEVRHYLVQLDLLRQECERAGKFRKAQECIDRIREINLRYAKKIEIEARKVNVGWKKKMMEEQQLELLTFHAMWENKMKEYDEGAELLRRGLHRQQTMEMQSEEDVIRLELMEKRPRPSKALVDLQDKLKVYVQQKMYMDADHVTREINRRKREEQENFEKYLERKLRERLHAVAERLRVERMAVEQRLTVNREELLSQRRQDFNILTKKHKAAISAQEQSISLIITKAQDCIHRQVKAYIKDPVKTGLDLIHLSEVALGGGGQHRSGSVNRKKIEWGASGREGTSFLSARHRDASSKQFSSIQQSPVRAATSIRPPWQD
ncbi:uncharacterized protein TM35_000023270 [Trypanosoma theileri]|uniref:Uncharacterized protein n=1 Tax=Trypanosoma theileri TaxID=67003 RepID=A0A1X0P838_9TRYP|nr:uncharacterized protein TM35_000023270 [Trypanosoma theileri]ORC93001.1 hypothetical protein TM35_000023270 [Trypanosoma theileri]